MKLSVKTAANVNHDPFITIVYGLQVEIHVSDNFLFLHNFFVVVVTGSLRLVASIDFFFDTLFLGFLQEVIKCGAFLNLYAAFFFTALLFLFTSFLFSEELLHTSSDIVSLIEMSAYPLNFSSGEMTRGMLLIISCIFSISIMVMLMMCRNKNSSERRSGPGEIGKPSSIILFCTSSQKRQQNDFRVLIIAGECFKIIFLTILYPLNILFRKNVQKKVFSKSDTAFVLHLENTLKNRCPFIGS